MRRTLILVLLIVTAGVAFGQGLPLVNQIEIKGLKRVEEGAVRAKISQKTGDFLSQERINEDIKTIYKMGYFDDVRVDIEPFEGGVRLAYTLKEKPTITRVEFQGNIELEEDKLREKITVTPGSIADTVLIQDNALKLRAFYEEEGYWLANVVPVTKKITEDELTLTYQIDEGSKVKIRKIVIEGNRNISSSKIKKAIETGEWWLFSFISSSGYYQKRQMEADIDKIRNLYYNEGYLKVVVTEPAIKVDPDRRGMTITVVISEGDQFKVSSVDFEGNKTYDNETIGKLITVTPGSLFRKNQLDKDIKAISDLYSDNGYALASVTPDLGVDEAGKNVRVSLRINEGEKYKVGRIEVSGNTRTRDNVIRREIRFDEGDVFSSSKLRRSYERINNLNFFDAVEVLSKPRYEEKVVDLEVKVKERPTGFLSVGGGYSSVDKFIATADLTQGNLFGKGQYLKIKGELGGSSSLYEISFKDPWFLDRPLAFSAGVYKTSREYIEYDKEAFGAYISLGKSLAEYWSGSISYNFERAKIDVDESKDECIAACPLDDNYDSCVETCNTNNEDISVIITDQRGTSTTSSITPTVVRDSRDNYLDPSRGSRNSLSFTFAGLGGTNAFIKGSADSAWYFPLGPTTFMLRGRFGMARGIFGKELPLYERFYVGGIYTVRGLDFGDAGPRDAATDDAIGGTEELIFNTEYIFPIIPEMRLKGLVFFDAGNAYEDFEEFGKLRYTTGLGIRWISPIGPIRIEWGYNIDRKPEESSNKFEFAFGSFF